MSTAQIETTTPWVVPFPQEVESSPLKSAKAKAEQRSSRQALGLSSGHSTKMVLTSLPLVLADMFTIVLAGAFSAVTVNLFLFGIDNPFATLALLSLAGFAINLMYGIYPGIGQNPVVEFRQVSIALTLLFAAFALASARSFSELAFFGIAWVVSIPTSHVLRSVSRKAACRTTWWSQPAIVFGDRESAMKIIESLESNPVLGLRPVGLVEDSYAFEALEELGIGDDDGNPPAQAADEGRCVFWAIVAVPDENRDQSLRVIERILRERYPELLVVPASGRLPSLWNGAQDCGGMAAVHMVERLLLPMPQLMKRVLDLTLATLAAPILVPVFALICLLIKFGSKGPIFYSQRRIGRNGQHFSAWKFRSMVADADRILQSHLDANPSLRAEWERDHKLKNDPRVTWIGKFLRKTSLDELPQLWNVLRGEMSLVGPRPIVDAEVDKYGDIYRMYRRVMPGITGLWQISGRNNTTYQERIDLDSFYVKNWSPWFDIFILLRTVKVVLLREGAY